MGKRKKPACLGSHILKVEKAGRFADQIEKIAVLARGGIGPAARSTPAVSGPARRTNIERPGVFLTSPTSQ